MRSLFYSRQMLCQILESCCWNQFHPWTAGSPAAGTRTFIETLVSCRGSPLSTLASNTRAKDSLDEGNDFQGPPCTQCSLSRCPWAWTQAISLRMQLSFPTGQNGPFCQAWLLPACPVPLWAIGHTVQMKFSFNWTAKQKRGNSVFEWKKMRKIWGYFLTLSKYVLNSTLHFVIFTNQNYNSDCL